MVQQESEADPSNQLRKGPTGIQGLDEITNGGLRRGRPTLWCGAASSGKTLLAMEFLVRGATQHNDPGVFISFEETEEYDLEGLLVRLKYAVDSVGAKRVVSDTVESLPAEVHRRYVTDRKDFVRAGSA
jgi:circadian clock protein KaiC